MLSHQSESAEDVRYARCCDWWEELLTNFSCTVRRRRDEILSRVSLSQAERVNFIFSRSYVHLTHASTSMGTEERRNPAIRS